MTFRRSALLRMLPPALVDFVQRKRTPDRIYESYEAALADADSYEDPLLTELVAAKGKQFAETLQTTNELDYSHLRILLAVVGSPSSTTLRVLDFGGGSGTHYWVAKKILGNNVELDWRVVETPAMVEAVTKYTLANEELTFYSDVQEAVSDATFDAVYASSSIHYTPDPYATLEMLCNIPSKRLVITRTPMADEDLILLQTSRMRDNGPGPVPEHLQKRIKNATVAYPVSVLKLGKVYEVLTNFGAEVLQINEDYLKLSHATNSFHMYGFIRTERSTDRSREMPASWAH